MQTAYANSYLKLLKMVLVVQLLFPSLQITSYYFELFHKSIMKMTTLGVFVSLPSLGWSLTDSLWHVIPKGQARRSAMVWPMHCRFDGQKAQEWFMTLRRACSYQPKKKENHAASFKVLLVFKNGNRRKAYKISVLVTLLVHLSFSLMNFSVPSFPSLTIYPHPAPWCHWDAVLHWKASQ